MFSKIAPNDITVSLQKKIIRVTPVDLEQNHVFHPKKQINGTFML